MPVNWDRPRTAKDCVGLSVSIEADGECAGWRPGPGGGAKLPGSLRDPGVSLRKGLAARRHAAGRARYPGMRSGASLACGEEQS